jgi:hypothetical protein
MSAKICYLCCTADDEARRNIEERKQRELERKARTERERAERGIETILLFISCHTIPPYYRCLLICASLP